MPRFYIIGGTSAKYIDAPDEAEARRLYMLAVWGKRPDSITPHAPNYSGRGLSVREQPDA